MNSSFRKRTRQLACLIPGVRSAASSTYGSKLLEDDDDDKSRLIDDRVEPEGKPYNLSRHEEELSQDEQHDIPLNDATDTSNEDTPSVHKAAPCTAMVLPVSDCSTDTWPEMTFERSSFADLEMDQSSISSTMTPSSLKSQSQTFSAPNSPHQYSVSSNTSFYSCPPSPHSVHTAPSTPLRSSRLPLTTPLPRRSLRKANSTSNLMIPMNLSQPPPCKQVQTTMSLLKSIKQQIKAFKRRESHLSTKLHVQRRERLHVQEQIAHLETRRLRVEAMFLRPLPLVLLVPVAFSMEDEYDLCLVSEGQDQWNALKPLIRIQLVRGSVQGVTISSKMGALLLHFGPTLSQPMAAAVSFLQQDPTTVQHFDLQPIAKEMDLSFWERTTCGQVLESDANQLKHSSCQFLFDALMEHKHLWRSQLTQVVDKKTRRIQWILHQEADSLYYDAIPASPTATAPATRELVVLD